MAIADPNGDGLISFPEYVFFTSLLSIPPKYFRIAFEIMDKDNNNQVDSEEFKKVMKVIQSHNPILQAARVPADTLESGTLLPGWFGKDGKKTLSCKEFEGFLTDLHNSIREIYFDTLDSNGDGFINGREFAMSLTNFASNKDLPRFAKRIAKLSEEDLGVRVNLKDFIDWKHIFDHIDEIDSAITLFVAGVGEEFSPQQLKRAAKSVTNVVLDDEQLKVLLSVFDEDGNGTLSRTEFADVFKKASSFGLAKPRDFGLVRFVSCCSDCVKKD